MTRLFIKNMVCSRCKYVVQSKLEQLGFHIWSIELGEVTLAEDLTKKELNSINAALMEFNFELIDGKETRIIELIKKELISMLSDISEERKFKMSARLSEKLLKDYSYLSSLFSEVEGQTIEHYFIQLKIEKAKELLAYNELSVGEIADLLGYSSVSHLSRQFKQVTGLAPSHFKTIKHHHRIPIDNL